MNAVEIVLRFLSIKRRNVDRLAAMMAEDRVFVDSLGQVVQGREKTWTSWRGH